MCFSYFGSKSRIAKYYPKPKYPLIIEPFAGAAWYSVHHVQRDNLVRAWLNDKYDVIYRIWKWLIEKATPEEILSVPILKKGFNIRHLLYSIPFEFRDLLGFCYNQGVAYLPNKVTSYGLNNYEWTEEKDVGRQVKNRLRFIFRLITLIYNWHSTNEDYFNLPNHKVTWFIDPPYQHGGERYVYANSQINYKQLAEWCKSRKGQVIVCENMKADWLPFERFVNQKNQKKSERIAESIFYLPENK